MISRKSKTVVAATIIKAIFPWLTTADAMVLARDPEFTKKLTDILEYFDKEEE